MLTFKPPCRPHVLMSCYGLTLCMKTENALQSILALSTFGYLRFCINFKSDIENFLDQQYTPEVEP